MITGDNVMMQFANNPVADLLAIYEKLTGYTLIKDTNIFEGATISLVTPKQVPKTEAIKLIAEHDVFLDNGAIADFHKKFLRFLLLSLY